MEPVVVEEALWTQKRVVLRDQVPADLEARDVEVSVVAGHERFVFGDLRLRYAEPTSDMDSSLYRYG